MRKRFKAASSGVVMVLAYALSGFCQPNVGAPKQDIIDQLLPNGAIPKEIRVMPEQRGRIIRELKIARESADTQRAQKAAFLMAALNEEYNQNRDYLFHVLAGCDYPEIRFGCDDMTGFYLIYLWEHGHLEILEPLLKTSIGSYNAAGSEGMGAYFGELVEKSPETFLNTVSAFQVPVQRKACYFAGLSDGGGVGAKSLAQVRKKLRGIGSEIALRCLKEIENANKPN